MKDIVVLIDDFDIVRNIGLDQTLVEDLRNFCEDELSKKRIHIIAFYQLKNVEQNSIILINDTIKKIHRTNLINIETRLSRLFKSVSADLHLGTINANKEIIQTKYQNSNIYIMDSVGLCKL